MKTRIINSQGVEPGKSRDHGSQFRSGLVFPIDLLINQARNGSISWSTVQAVGWEFSLCDPKDLFTIIDLLGMAHIDLFRQARRVEGQEIEWGRFPKFEKLHKLSGRPTIEGCGRAFFDKLHAALGNMTAEQLRWFGKAVHTIKEVLRDVIHLQCVSSGTWRPVIRGKALIGVPIMGAS